MRFMFVLIASFLFSNLSIAATPDEDLEQYVKIFSGHPAFHSEAADTLEWKGLSDTRLFDIIEQRLQSDYVAANNDRQEKNRVARYMRALGYSGQQKYAATLQKYVRDPIYGRYADSALKDIPIYQKWNVIISNRSAFDPKYSDDTNRIMNMLRSDDIFLQRIGAKRVYFTTQDKDVYDFLATLVSSKLQQSNYGDREAQDTFAWMVKALGGSKDPKYVALITEVANTSRSSAISRHAREALQKNYYVTIR
jgi:hypothetical protein